MIREITGSVAREKLLGHRRHVSLAFPPLDFPNLIEDKVVPFFGGVGDAQGGGQVWDFSVMPADEDDFAGVFAAKHLTREGSKFRVFILVVDGKMKGLR